jgi:hypothetical protein
MIPFRMRLLPAALPLVLAIASCSEPLAPTPAPGRLLFESEWTGTGADRWWAGYSIDADGRVWSYGSGPDPVAIPEGDVYTAAELALKYAQDRHLRAQLRDGETVARYDEVGAVLKAGLTEAKPGCPGLAIERFYALVYDARHDRYTRVLLHVRGGVGQENTAPEASDLYRWLLQITEEGYNGPNECDPYE